MVDKGAPVDKRIARVAARQHGVVSVRQLEAAGLSRAGAAQRCRAGRLHRLHRGVYAVGHSAVSSRGRWMAAVLATGTLVSDGEHRTVLERWNAALSHRSAGELWGLLMPGQGQVHVSLPSRSGRRERKGIQIHRPRSLPLKDVTSHHGIPVTTPHRTIADLEWAAAERSSTCCVSARELRRAIRQADVLGLPLGPEIVPDGTRSDLERAFLRLCRAHDLPVPDVNVRIDAMLVDFAWPKHRLIVETDGYRYHRGRAAFEDDRARDLRLRAIGFDVVRLSGRQVADEPERVAVVLRTALAQAAGARVDSARNAPRRAIELRRWPPGQRRRTVRASSS